VSGWEGGSGGRTEEDGTRIKGLFVFIFFLRGGEEVLAEGGGRETGMYESITKGWNFPSIKRMISKAPRERAGEEVENSFRIRASLLLATTEIAERNQQSPRAPWETSEA